MSSTAEFILTLSCPDKKGIVHAVSQFLFDTGCNIIESQQFGDVASHAGSGTFFMRVHFESDATFEVTALEERFDAVGVRFAMTARFHRFGAKMRALFLVGKQGHCLNDLLFRVRAGWLNVEPIGVVSNHADLSDLAARHGVPFHHLPLATGADADIKRAQEERIEALIVDECVELVVLARYMQILSELFCRTLAGRAINIHHSFLPSFKGARPYEQAHLHGVKLIGATAHYVTATLDEGPIIEQDVERVDHSLSVADMTAAGRDVEALVLARAVRWHVEHRVLVNGMKTVVFR